MANANSTLSRAPSKPEKVALWLFTTSGNYRQILGFLLIAALTVISIRFNYELGKLSAVDETSKQLLPAGYALLDLCCLFLSGFVGVKSRSPMRRLIAWGWFCFLLCLSLWAAASFTLSVDHRIANRDLEHAIEQKRVEVESLNSEVAIWRDNVAQAVKFKTKHQNTLNGVQEKQRTAADELHELETSLIAPTMAIYHKAAPYTPLNADTLSLVVRLLWAGAMTLSPLIIVLLVVTEFTVIPETPQQPRKKEPTPHAEKPTTRAFLRDCLQSWRNKRKLPRFMARLETSAASKQNKRNAEMTNTRAFEPISFSAPTEEKHLETIASVAQNQPWQERTGNNIFRFPSDIVPKKGHNQHTRMPDLNGLKYALEWLARQSAGRVTRSKISHAAKIHTREGVNRIIESLLDRGLLVRVGNGQLYKPKFASVKTKPKG